MKTIISHNKEGALEQLMGLIGFPQLFLCCILSIDVLSFLALPKKQEYRGLNYGSRAHYRVCLEVD